MKLKIRLLFLLAFLGAIASAQMVDLEGALSRKVIVIFQQGINTAGFASQGAPDPRVLLTRPEVAYLEPGVVGLVRSVEQTYGFRATHMYSHAVKGFAATVTANQIAALRNNPYVASIEEDKVISVGAQTLPWGINRIDADLSSTLTGNGSGTVSGVNIYIVDTGIDTAHVDLKVVQHVNFAGDANNKDCNGHGTHVAGTAAALDNDTGVVGVAPGANLTGVKVLGCTGSGPISNIIAGVDWVTANAVKPAVANLSLGGSASPALDAAIRASAQTGIFYALAAGNYAGNACNYSPSRTGGVSGDGIMSVAAITSSESEATYSNYGTCVDIWAPGSGVVSTRLGGGTSSKTGTSMAAPHVAGAAALYLSNNQSATPGAVESRLRLDRVATGKLSKNGAPIQRLWVALY